MKFTKVENGHPFTSVGAYPLFYLTPDELTFLCADCAKSFLEEEKYEGEKKYVTGGINYTIPSLCDGCGADIPAMYPEEE